MNYLRIIFVITGTILFCGLKWSYAQDDHKLRAYDILENRGEICFSFKIGLGEVDSLSDIISIDRFDGKSVTAYANITEFEEFLKTGKYFEIIENHDGAKSLNMAYSVSEMINWNKYPTYEVYVEMMQKFANDFPEICSLDTIGYSVQNRVLLAVKISDNVKEDEVEPKFFYSGQMHGDELVCGMLFLRLIDHLLNEYGSDTQITDLVNGLQIYINPISNPDGMYYGGNADVSKSRRYNANSIDLNRNFPRIDGSITIIEPEIQAMIDYAGKHNFLMSANSHSGAEVINYPFDDISTLPADVDWWKIVCREYATNVQENSPYGYFDDLDNGVTNGYAWYSISGSRQDYMNYFRNCREVTMELSNSKLVDSDLLPDFWNYNKKAFLDYMQQTTYGLRGIVTDSTTGEPLLAKVLVENHDNLNSHVYSSLLHGDYYRLLFEGNYNITFSSEGYESKTFEISVENYKQQILDVELNKIETIIEIASLTELNIFPNPVVDIFNIKSEDVIQNVIIKNIYGKNLKELFPDRPIVEINIENLPAGIYLLDIKVKDHIFKTKILKL